MFSRFAAYAFIHKFKMDQDQGEQTIIDLLYTQRDKLAEWHIENRCTNVNYKDKRGDSMLTVAAWNGFDGVIQLLLLKGANIHIRNKYYSSAIIEACRSGRTEIVELLLAYGARIDDTDGFGFNPLMTATRWDHIEVVKLLLRRGADTNKQNMNGNSALIVAARERHVECARLLLELGADVNLKNRNGTTALMMATARDHRGSVKMLLINGANIHDEDDGGKKASENTDREDIQEVIEKWQVTMVVSVLKDLQMEHCLDYDFYKDLQEFGIDEKKPVIEEEEEDYDVVADY